MEGAQCLDGGGPWGHAPRAVVLEVQVLDGHHTRGDAVDEDAPFGGLVSDDGRRAGEPVDGDGLVHHHLLHDVRAVIEVDGAAGLHPLQCFFKSEDNRGVRAVGVVGHRHRGIRRRRHALA